MSLTALHKTAVENVQKGNYREALGFYETLLQKSTKEIDIAWRYYDKGVCLYALGEVAEADQSFEAALERKLNDARLYRNRALCKRSLGKEAAAFEIYCEAFKLYPDDLDILNGFALQCFRLGRLEEARVAARHIAKACDDAMMESVRGEARATRRVANALDSAALILNDVDPEFARHCYQRAVLIDPTIADRAEYCENKKA